MKRTWIKNARIVNEGKIFHGSIVIENEVIAEVLAEETVPAQPCGEIIDAKGYYLMPGVIDDHVHFRDPGLTHKADIHTESTAAAAGGVTSFMDMPNTTPQTTTLEALNAKFADAATKSIVNYSFYFGATNTNADVLPTLDKSRVCGVKLFMGASTGNMLVDRMEVLRKVFANAGILIAAHCEEQSIISANTTAFKEKYGEDPDIKYHPQIRSAEACAYSSSLPIRLAKENNARLHILHISTAQELDLFEDKPLSEKKITAEACVSHLYFYDKDYEALKGHIKCNPSIKTLEDRNALRKALSTNRIDVIGTDHAPHLLKEKEGGALKAVSGMPMIQFSLVSMLQLVDEGVFTLETIVEKMCHAPAQIYRINERGYIREGYRADLVLVRPDTPWEVTADKVLSKCGWSPLEGHTFNWKVERTFANGHPVYSDGMVDDAYRGEELRFGE